MSQRIQKVLASAGVASRRHVEEMIRQGRVSVNGQIVVDLPIMVEPGVDRIALDGELIRLGEDHGRPKIYILMNKPKGVYTINVAQGEQVRAIDLLPPNLPGRVYPVGRLDAESKGLLLLTNDGDLTNKLTHPRYGVPKTYRATVDGYVEALMLQKLQSGIWLPDRQGGGFKTSRCRVKIINRSRASTVFEITVRDRRNREVRRMLAATGHKVRDLTRVSMGPLTIHGLAPGQFRPLTGKEIKQLRQAGSNPHPKTDGEIPKTKDQD